MQPGLVTHASHLAGRPDLIRASRRHNPLARALAESRRDERRGTLERLWRKRHAPRLVPGLS